MANAEDIITKNREQSAAFQEAMKAADVGMKAALASIED